MPTLFAMPANGMGCGPNQRISLNWIPIRNWGREWMNIRFMCKWLAKRNMKKCEIIHVEFRRSEQNAIKLSVRVCYYGMHYCFCQMVMSIIFIQRSCQIENMKVSVLVQQQWNIVCCHWIKSEWTEHAGDRPRKIYRENYCYLWDLHVHVVWGKKAENAWEFTKARFVFVVLLLVGYKPFHVYVMNVIWSNYVMLFTCSSVSVICSYE